MPPRADGCWRFPRADAVDEAIANSVSPSNLRPSTGCRSTALRRLCQGEWRVAIVACRGSRRVAVEFCQCRREAGSGRRGLVEMAVFWLRWECQACRCQIEASGRPWGCHGRFHCGTMLTRPTLDGKQNRGVPLWLLGDGRPLAGVVRYQMDIETWRRAGTGVPRQTTTHTAKRPINSGLKTQHVPNRSKHMYCFAHELRKQNFM